MEEVAALLWDRRLVRARLVEECRIRPFETLVDSFAAAFALRELGQSEHDVAAAFEEME